MFGKRGGHAVDVSVALTQGGGAGRAQSESSPRVAEGTAAAARDKQAEPPDGQLLPDLFPSGQALAERLSG